MRLTAENSSLLVGVTAGSGFVAATAERSGADFLLAVNAARLRNMGAPSIACVLPLANAATQVEDYALAEMMSLVNIPVIVGTNCWRSAFDPKENAARIHDLGFAGAMNFPPAALFPQSVQKHLEAADVGFATELRMLRAVQDHGDIAIVHCASISQGRQAALAGLTHILLNYGWNTGGALSPTSEFSLEDAAALAAGFSKQVRRINPEAIILLEGGPIESATDLSLVLRHAKIDGYIGGSTFERLPVERSIADRIAAFHMADATQVAANTTEAKLLAFGRKAGFIGKSPALCRLLAQLRRARDADDPLLFLSLPPGESADPCLKALTSHKGSTVAEIDGLAQTASETAALLFGHHGAGGYLSDGTVGSVIVKNAQALPPSLQQKLADTIVAQLTSPARDGPQIILMSSQQTAVWTHKAAGLVDLCEANAIHVPDLKDRFEDVKLLLSHVMAIKLPHAPQAARCFSPAALRRLRGYHWPGNTAQLVGLCTALADPTRRQPITFDELDGPLNSAQAVVAATKSTDADRRAILIDALMRNGFRKGQTAESLGISRKTLYNRMKSYGLT